MADFVSRSEEERGIGFEIGVITRDGDLIQSLDTGEDPVYSSDVSCMIIQGFDWVTKLTRLDCFGVGDFCFDVIKRKIYF